MKMSKVKKSIEALWILPSILFPYFWSDNEYKGGWYPEEPRSVGDRITAENSRDLRSVDKESEQQDFNNSPQNS